MFAVPPHGDPRLCSVGRAEAAPATAPADALSSSGDEEEEEATRKSVADEAAEAAAAPAAAAAGRGGSSLRCRAGRRDARLQKGAIGESLMTITALLDCPFRVRVTELQALDITWLVTG